MTDTTQPPAETLARDVATRIARDLMVRHFGPGKSSAEPASWVIDAMIEYAALTRRAGGDAIPAGMSAVMGRILGHYSEDPGTLARIKGMVAQYREAPFRSADWLAGEIMRILDSEPANDTTPKPPAGGDAGAVERAYRQGQIDMRDRAVAVCDERRAEEQEGYGLNRAAQNYFRARNAVRALEPAALALPAPVVEVSRDMLAEVMQDAWGEICDDAAAHPSDMQHGRGTVLFYRPAHWTDLIALRLNERLAALSEGRSHG